MFAPAARAASVSGDRRQPRQRWRRGPSRWSGWPRAAAAQPGPRPAGPAPRPEAPAARRARRTSVSPASPRGRVARRGRWWRPLGLTVAAREAVGGQRPHVRPLPTSPPARPGAR